MYLFVRDELTWIIDNPASFYIKSDKRCYKTANLCDPIYDPINCEPIYDLKWMIDNMWTPLVKF